MSPSELAKAGNVVLLQHDHGDEYLMFYLKDVDRFCFTWGNGYYQDGYRAATVDRDFSNILDWMPLDDLSEPTSSGICTCDFYTVVLTTGCRCGGK